MRRDERSMKVSCLFYACTSPKPCSVLKDGACILKEKGRRKALLHTSYFILRALKGRSPGQFLFTHASDRQNNLEI